MKRLLLLLTACSVGVDPQWQLDHDRVIAIRANPPHISSGQASALDALLGRKGEAPFVADLETAKVVSPTSLASALVQPAQQWVVVAPPPDKLAAARTELGLAADAPVPLRVRATFPLGEAATKIVWLGDTAQNPALDSVLIDGKESAATNQLTVAAGVKVPLVVDLGANVSVNWLTSCGTMHDFDLQSAYLKVDPEDPHEGSLAIIARDDQGGTAWKVWSITAQ